MQVTGQEAGDPVVSADFRQSEGEGMYQMEKIATGVSYSTSAAGTGFRYWIMSRPHSGRLLECWGVCFLVC